MRGFGVVSTPPVADKEIAITCKRNTLTLGLKKKNIVHPNLKPATMKMVQPVVGSTRSEPSSCQANG